MFKRTRHTLRAQRGGKRRTEKQIDAQKKAAEAAKQKRDAQQKQKEEKVAAEAAAALLEQKKKAADAAALLKQQQDKKESAAAAEKKATEALEQPAPQPVNSNAGGEKNIMTAAITSASPISSTVTGEQKKNESVIVIDDTLAASSSNAATAAPAVTSETLCSWRSDNKDAALTIWKSKLTSEPFTFLTTGNPLTPEQYDIVVAKQDELFGIAMTIIYEQLGIQPGEDESIILEKYNAPTVNEESLRSYIEDIARLIFKGPIETKIPGGVKEEGGRLSTNKTKIEKLISSNSKYHDYFPEILLNPERVKNQFIFWLAEFIKHQRNNSKLLDKIEDKNDKQTLTILADRYNSLIKANTLNMTTLDLRDGMDLTMTIEAAKQLYISFWRCFLTRCIGKFYKNVDTIVKYGESFKYDISGFNIAKSKVGGDDYAFIAAAIYAEKHTELVAELKTAPGYSQYYHFAIHLIHALEQPSLLENAESAAETEN